MSGGERCGGYEVHVRAGEIVVVCASCGPSVLTVEEARRLVGDLVGPFGRFHTNATRAERLRLSVIVEMALETLEAATCDA